MSKVFNFSAGPAMIFPEVLHKAQAELTNWLGQGVSVMEVSHRGKYFMELIAQAEKQPGTHTQVGKIKSKLNQSKQQILEMELATQQKSCDVGLARLNSMKSYTEGTEGTN